MMVFTTKLKKKHLLILLAAIGAAILILLLAKPAENTAGDSPEPVKTETNQQRVEFLKQFGWEVEEDPVETGEVKIPREFDEVTQRYNELQKTQGFDLTEQAGKTLKRYVYQVKNYPDSEDEFFATLLIYRSKVVGGDIASNEENGLMQGLNFPGGLHTVSEEASPETEEETPKDGLTNGTQDPIIKATES